MAESGTIRVAEYRKAVTKMCVVQDIILNQSVALLGKSYAEVGIDMYQCFVGKAVFVSRIY